MENGPHLVPKVTKAIQKVATNASRRGLEWVLGALCAPFAGQARSNIRFTSDLGGFGSISGSLFGGCSITKVLFFRTCVSRALFLGLGSDLRGLLIVCYWLILGDIQ